MYVYCLPPIDHWGGYLRPEQAVADRDETGEKIDRRSYEAFLDEAKTLARRLGCEGDMREGPHIAAMPSPGDVKFLVAWKQDNNGTTFVASPFPLPHLQKEAFQIAQS